MPWGVRGTLVSWANCSARPRPAAPPCAPTRPARCMSGFWTRQVCNPSTFSSAAVKACKPDASNCNPSTFGSAAVKVYNLAGGKQTSVDWSPLFEPRHTSVSLAADDLTGPDEDSAPVTVRPLRAHGAGRRPILEHDVCRDGEHKMEQALAAAAAWPYADEPPPTVAEGHRQRLRQPPCRLLFAMVTRLIANGSPQAKSAGCLAALKKEKDKMVARRVWDERRRRVGERSQERQGCFRRTDLLHHGREARWTTST